MDSKPTVRAFAALIGAVVFWSSSPVFIRYLSAAYDPFTQQAFRYACGAVPLVAVSLLVWPREFLRVLVHPGILLVAFFNATMQTAWTTGIYQSDSATLPQLIARITAIFVVIISYFVFREERRVIRHPLFRWGTALSLAGLVAVLTKDPRSLVPQFDRSIALMLLASLLWSAYAVASRHAVKGMHPIPMFAAVALYTALGLGALSAFAGEPRSILEAGPRITTIAFLSGVVPIALAHTTYNTAQKHLGAAFCSSFIIILPLFTYLFAKLALEDEHVTWSQWAGAAVLIAGTYLVTRAERLVRAQSLAVQDEPA